MHIIAKPLTKENFSAFGEVLSIRKEAGRVYYEDALANARSTAWPSLSIATRTETSSFPLKPAQMERHEFSSQSFIPLQAVRWLVAVAPHAPEGGPDTSQLQAFIAGPEDGVTYAANVWHHPLTIFDGPATFAVFMWRNGTATDEEFVDLPSGITIGSNADQKGE
jgi:ureidoglycolate lyase